MAPLYDFECFDCGRDFEILCPIDRRAHVHCPYGFDHEVRQILKKGHGGLSLFKSDTWRDIDFHPLRIETPQQLRRELDARGATANYLEDGIWKTSPERTYEEIEGETKHGKRG